MNWVISPEQTWVAIMSKYTVHAVHEPGPLQWPPILYHVMPFSSNNSNTTFPQTLAEEVKLLMIATLTPTFRCTVFHINFSGTSREEGDCSLLLTEAAWQRTSWKAGANSAALLEQNLTGGSSCKAFCTVRCSQGKGISAWRKSCSDGWMILCSVVIHCPGCPLLSHCRSGGVWGLHHVYSSTVLVRSWD